MGYIGLYESVRKETCDNENGNNVAIKGNNIVINWDLCPIVTATATRLRFSFLCLCRSQYERAFKQGVNVTLLLACIKDIMFAR